MQSINVQAPTPVFMTALFGSALACLAVAVWGLADWNDDYSPYLLAGGALYVAGVPGVTMLFNVPRNNALARIEPGSPEAAAYWRRYLVEWTPGTTCGS
jgi:uncharacterized membrane protein